MVSEGPDLTMQRLELPWERGCVMTVRCSSSLQQRAGSHNTFPGRQTGDGRHHLMMSRVLASLLFPSLIRISAWAQCCLAPLHPPTALPTMIFVWCVQALISIQPSFIIPFLSVSSAAILPQHALPGCVSLAALPISRYFFSNLGDWQQRWHLLSHMHIRHLGAIPASLVVVIPRPPLLN